MTTLQIPSHDGQTFDALYIEHPARQAPAIVLVQEIFGINLAMQEAARQWAALGFHVVCPDLFWRQQAGVVLDPQKPEDFEQGVGLMQGMDHGLAIADLGAARDWLKKTLGHDRITVLGYCLGGRLAVHAAIAQPFKCAVSYYGVGLEQLLQDATRATPPALLHIAGQDAFVPAEARATILQTVAALPQFEAHVYEDCDHAFARPQGHSFNAAAAALAEKRSLDFMARHLA
jgi:carboxymethylenebutenolidase